MTKAERKALRELAEKYNKPDAEAKFYAGTTCVASRLLALIGTFTVEDEILCTECWKLLGYHRPQPPEPDKTEGDSDG